MHEVIDQGGEPITVQEYFGVGRTTEFRYGIKVAEAVRHNNFASLGGVYDQVGGEWLASTSQKINLYLLADRQPVTKYSCRPLVTAALHL